MSRRTYRSSGRGAMISVRSNLSYLDTIRQKPDNKNMSVMKDSCFGHLFSIPDLKFQGQLHNMLLRRLVCGSVNDQVLTFNINNCNLEFRPLDFAIITGLKFGTDRFLPVESELHRHVFGSKAFVTLDDIEKAFKGECRASAGCFELSLKLAFLLIVCGILLVRGSSYKDVDLTYVHLADDIKTLESFSWGRVAYELVVRQAHRSKSTLDKLARHHKQLKFKCNEFAFALQVWAYEVIPVVAGNCAQKIEGAGNCFPRIVRSIASKAIKFDTVHMYFRNVRLGRRN